MQVWNLLHAARWKCRTQKCHQKSPSGHHRTTLSGYIIATKARIDNRKKNLLSSDMSSTCSHNMVNFVLLTAEIHPLVWGTPANFNGFRVLAALLHGIYSSGRQPKFAALNRGRHLCSAGQPSGWALAHILVCYRLPRMRTYSVLRTSLYANRWLAERVWCHLMNIFKHVR